MKGRWKFRILLYFLVHGFVVYDDTQLKTCAYAKPIIIFWRYVLFGKLFGRKKPRPLNQEIYETLDEAINWILLHTVQELREDGYEEPLKNMPFEKKSAFIQYLFGATFAIEEDLSNQYQLDDWASSSRSKILTIFLSENDIDRAKLEYSRAFGLVENPFATFLVLGAGAVRNFLNRDVESNSPAAWLDSYEGAFLAGVRLFKVE
ncbi:hypothetical protein [Vibrio cholerae]|uniref:hypothetical protein n=1 Tax=Vibrio cholerae TaxID=666 RepID=UPI003D7C7FDA